MMQTIPLARPFINTAVKNRVLAVLDSGHLTEGAVTRAFERSVADYVGASHAIAVNACTTGLEMALRCLGVGSGDEVVVPDYTYPATADAVNIVGATAVIVDVDPQTMLIDYAALESAITSKTKAVLPVSLFGNPLDWGRLCAIKDKYGLFIVEDAACALGSAYQRRKTGTWADISVFSHHPRKFITTGEGGTVCTENTAWAEWMRAYKHFGFVDNAARREIHFDHVGTNYKLSDVLAAIGLAQMEMVAELLAERQRLSLRYQECLRGVPLADLPRITAGGEHAWQTFCVFVDERDRIMDEMRSQGIEVQIGTFALHLQRAFQQNPQCRIAADVAGSRRAFDRALALPLFHGMTIQEQETVIDALRRSCAGT